MGQLRRYIAERPSLQRMLMAASLLSIGSALPRSSVADVSLPQILGDNMVLQRHQPIRIWGMASPGERVRVAFRGESAVRTQADQRGNWRVTLLPRAAGGPLELSVVGRNSLTIRNILMGDVWIASGQSNMEFSLHETDTGAAAVAAAADSQLRLFRVTHDACARPKSDVLPATWFPATAQSAGDFSAVAFLFAKQLRQRYHVPIGVVEAAWGGTYAESWMSADALQRFPEYRERLRSLRSFTARDETEYVHYVDHKARWNAAHRTEDRGTGEQRAIWADPQFEVANWRLLELPRPDSAWGMDFDGFDGSVWYRRTLTIPPAMAGQDLELHLGVPYHTGQAFYDGRPIEAVSAPAGVYRVAGDRVHAGLTTIAQRVTGSGGFIMLSGKPEDMFARGAGANLPLAGPWSYQPGADLAEFPKPPPLARFYGFPGITVLSNAMIEPLTPLRIKGVIWYQGESNVGAAESYRQLFPALIRDWRRRWESDFSFLFVQLAGYSPDPSQPAEAPWAELREAQQAALQLPHTGMATAVDLGVVDNVHPTNKRDVALRLELAAARVAYDEEVLASGPTLRATQIEGSKVRVHFDHVGSGLMAKDRYGYPRGFAIAAHEGVFVWAKAVIDGPDVLVFSDAISKPERVRYDWANTPDGNLYSKDGLPAVPFRSDSPSAMGR